MLKDESGSIVSGTFLIYDKNVCIYFHAGNSYQGLKTGAGYLTVNNAIKFARSRGVDFDLFGSYLYKGDNYQKLYQFKKQWGKEYDISQYIATNWFINKVRRN